MVPPPASTIRSPFPLYSQGVNHIFSSGNKNKPHFNGVVCETTLNTKVQTSFTLSDKRKIRMIARQAFHHLTNQSRLDSGCAHHALLSTFPPIWVSENKVCAVFQGAPQLDAIGMRLFYVISSALMEVS